MLLHKNSNITSKDVINKINSGKDFTFKFKLKN